MKFSTAVPHMPPRTPPLTHHTSPPPFQFDYRLEIRLGLVSSDCIPSYFATPKNSMNYHITCGTEQRSVPGTAFKRGFCGDRTEEIARWYLG